LKRYWILVCWLLALTNVGFPLHQASGHESPGVAPLVPLSAQCPYSLLKANIRPLFSPLEQESFLEQIEGIAPNWPDLHDHEGEESGERLFRFNRERDKAREHHSLLHQQIAFLWSGLLRHYQVSQQGFTVALGPTLIQTQWGLVRFKPVGLPDVMVAVPPRPLQEPIRKGIEAGEAINIHILFIGRLQPNESIIYGFSHDGRKQGMIMPVVKIEAVQYFFSAPDKMKQNNPE